MQSRPSFTSGIVSQDSIQSQSPKYLVSLPKSALDIEIVTYRSIGENIMYDEHLFIIDIHCESIYYSVERSYVDFVEMYIKIKKRFPQCDIPLLPLDATLQLQKLLNKDENRKSIDHRKSLSSIESPRKSIGNLDTNSRDLIKSPKNSGFRMDSMQTEDIGSKIPELKIYMRTLLTFHEIVVSDEFTMFLDEERPCNYVYSFIRTEPPNEIELLLASTPAVTITVRKTDDVFLDVLPGQLVIWKFFLESFDIGFQVEVDGEIKVSYTRYAGTETHPITGSLEVGMRGKCLLKWDNSYAKLRNKVLTRQVRVVDPDQYNIAKNACLEAQREKRKYDNQRKSLKHATLRHAAAVSGVIHSSSIDHEIDEENIQIIQEMKEELDQAKKEKEDLSALLQRTLAEVDELHEQNNELNAHIDKTAARLAELDEELAHSDHHIDDLEGQINILEQEKADLQIQVKDLSDIVDAAQLASQLASQHEQELKDQFLSQINELELKHKQQLEEAIQDAAGRIEDSSSANGYLKKDNLRLQSEISTALSTISNLENQVTQLENQKNDLETTVQTLQFDKNDLEHQVNKLNQTLDGVLSSEKEIQSLFELAKERVLTAESRSVELQELYDASTKKNGLLEEQIERIKWRSKEEIDEFSSKILQLEQELEISQTNLNTVNELLLNSNANHEQNNNVFQTSLEESKVELKKANNEINELKKLLIEKEHEIQKNSIEINTYQNQINEKNELNLLLEKEYLEKETNLTNQIKSLELEISKHQNESIPQLRQEVINLEKQNSSLQLLNQNIQNDLALEQSKTKDLQEINSKYEKELIESRLEIKNLLERKDDLQQLLELSTKNTTNNNNNINNSPHPLDSNITKLNENLDRALQDLRDEREKFDNYRSKKDIEILELHKQNISLQEKLEISQNMNRDINENLELERKNLLSTLNENKKELTETKKQLNDTLLKLNESEKKLLFTRQNSQSQSQTKSQSQSKQNRRRSQSKQQFFDENGIYEYDSYEEYNGIDYDNEGDNYNNNNNDINDNDDELERATVIKYHRDLAVARAEIADLAQQLVESAHREDEMQQCITDLQQEISIMLQEMTQLQQQQQLFNQASIIRQSTSNILSQQFSPQPSSLNSSPLPYNPSRDYRESIQSQQLSPTKEYLMNYELIENYKKLYNETLQRNELLENEILKEKERNNEQTNEIISKLNKQITELVYENTNLKKENNELRLNNKELNAIKFNNDSKINALNEILNKTKLLYLESTEKYNNLEKEILIEREENNSKLYLNLTNLTNELNKVKHENDSLNNEIKEVNKINNEVKQENEKYKLIEIEKNKEIKELRDQLHIFRSSLLDVAKPLNRLLSQEEN